MLLLMPFSVILLLCHLVAFGLFAIAVGMFELSHAFGGTVPGGLRHIVVEVARRQMRAACVLVPAFLLFVLLSPIASSSGGYRWSTLQEKMTGIVALTYFSSPLPELTLLVLAAVGLAGALASGAVRLRRETIAIVAAMVLLFLGLPRVGLGAGFIDYRVPWATSLFLLATIVPGANSIRYGKVMSLWFGALVATRVAIIAVLWLTWEPTIAGISAALNTLPVGTRLTAVEGNLGSVAASRRPALVAMGAYAVTQRQALWPFIFADIPGQILHITPPYKQEWQPGLPDGMATLCSECDYVLVLRPASAQLAVTLPLRCITQGHEFALYAVDVRVTALQACQ
jgi:hypothetical protein